MATKTSSKSVYVFQKHLIVGSVEAKTKAVNIVNCDSVTFKSNSIHHQDLSKLLIEQAGHLELEPNSISGQSLDFHLGISRVKDLNLANHSIIGSFSSVSLKSSSSLQGFDGLKIKAKVKHLDISLNILTRFSSQSLDIEVLESVTIASNTFHFFQKDALAKIVPTGPDFKEFVFKSNEIEKFQPGCLNLHPSFYPIRRSRQPGQSTLCSEDQLDKLYSVKISNIKLRKSACAILSLNHVSACKLAAKLLSGQLCDDGKCQRDQILLLEVAKSLKCMSEVRWKKVYYKSVMKDDLDTCAGQCQLTHAKLPDTCQFQGPLDIKCNCSAGQSKLEIQFVESLNVQLGSLVVNNCHEVEIDMNIAATIGRLDIAKAGNLVLKPLRPGKVLPSNFELLVSASTIQSLDPDSFVGQSQSISFAKSTIGMISSNAFNQFFSREVKFSQVEVGEVDSGSMTSCEIQNFIIVNSHIKYVTGQAFDLEAKQFVLQSNRFSYLETKSLAGILPSEDFQVSRITNNTFQEFEMGAFMLSLPEDHLESESLFLDQECNCEMTGFMTEETHHSMETLKHPLVKALQCQGPHGPHVQWIDFDKEYCEGVSGHEHGKLKKKVKYLTLAIALALGFCTFTIVLVFILLCKVLQNKRYPDLPLATEDRSAVDANDEFISFASAISEVMPPNSEFEMNTMDASQNRHTMTNRRSSLASTLRITRPYFQNNTGLPVEDTRQVTNKDRYSTTSSVGTHIML